MAGADGIEPPLLESKSSVLPLDDTPNEQKQNLYRSRGFLFGAGEEARTLDINLGKVALYQLSYARVVYYISFLLKRTRRN